MASDYLDFLEWKQLSCLISIVGGLHFIIVTFLAMLFYPDGYSFTEDFLSYLGTENNVTTGSNNEISRILFIIACVGTGASLIPFWIVIRTLFDDDSLTKFFSYFGSILGLISAPFLMGIAIFPGDTQYILHAYSARGFFLLFPAAILLYSFAMLLKKDYQNIYSLIGFTFCIIIGLFLLGFYIQIAPILQKIIFYSFIIWIIVQSIKIWKKIDSENINR